MVTSNARAEAPGALLQFWSFFLPALKCALCPACLSLFAGIFAGTRLGFVGSEHFHGSVIAVALLADLFILRAAMKHHQSRWPLVLCGAGGVVAVVGHLALESLEYVGFALLMAAAIHNLVLLRRHRHHGGPCCAHDGHVQRASPAPQRG